MADKVNSVSDLTRGDVITFNYMSGHDERPVVLFLNLFNNLVHGINLHYLSAAQIAYLKVILGNELYNIHMIDNPKYFYDRQIKGYHLQFAYRTYTPAKMIRLHKIGYKVQTIEKDTGIEKKPEEMLKKPVEHRYTTKPDIKSTLPDDYIEQLTKTTIPKNIFGNFWEW